MEHTLENVIVGIQRQLISLWVNGQQRLHVESRTSLGIDRWENLAAKKEVDIPDGEKIGSELMEENEKKSF